MNLNTIAANVKNEASVAKNTSHHVITGNPRYQ